jgi:hypothetical protein
MQWQYDRDSFIRARRFNRLTARRIDIATIGMLFDVSFKSVIRAVPIDGTLKASPAVRPRSFLRAPTSSVHNGVKVQLGSPYDTHMSKEYPDVIIGLDGGTSKTLCAVICCSTKAVLGRATTSGSNAYATGN